MLNESVQINRSSLSSDPSIVPQPGQKRKRKAGDDKASEISKKELSPKVSFKEPQTSQIQAKNLGPRVQFIPSTSPTGLDAFEPFLFSEESQTETEAAAPIEKESLQEEELSKSETEETTPITSLEEADEEADEEIDEEEGSDHDLSAFYEHVEKVHSSSSTSTEGNITSSDYIPAHKGSSSRSSAAQSKCDAVVLGITLTAALSFLVMQVWNTVLLQEK